jgi:2,3,4,5-tetrahydropyridine-2-carboxylate N-succinyltransferase
VSTLQNVIENAWERRAELSPDRADAELRDAVDECLAGLDAGTVRVAEPRDGRWVVILWL